MKKLLLLLLIPFSAYSASIDVGETVSDSYTTNTNTWFNLANPANGTGTIDHIDVKTGANGTIDFATFTDEGSDVYSTNGTATIALTTGTLSLDAPGDFTAFNVTTGDYIGMYSATYMVARWIDTGAGGAMYKSGDNVPCSSETFASFGGASAGFYLYVTGETGGSPLVTPDALPITVAVLAPTIIVPIPLTKIQGATLQGGTFN